MAAIPTRSLTSPLPLHDAFDHQASFSTGSYSSSSPELTDAQTPPSSVSSPNSSRNPSPKNIKVRNMNFEDIALDTPDHSDPKPILVRKTSRNNVSATAPVRRTSTPSRPVLAALQTQSSGRYPAPVRSAAKLVASPSSRRAFTNSAISPETRPTSASSSRPDTASHSHSRSVLRSATFAGSLQSAGPLLRRTDSLHGGRKSAQQLEAEYHDSDDDLPDDASLFNVPITPVLSRGWSKSSSPRISPDHSPSSRSISPGPIPLGHAHTFTDSPRLQRSTTQITSRKRPHRTTTDTFSTVHPPTHTFNPPRDVRIKSWSNVVADLDHEALILAQKLEHHASTDADLKVVHRSSAPSAFALPPIQQTPLDFMPASKEKQRVLSRTRPSWLPPKDPKEEAKHLKQYKEMMAKAQELERKREEHIQQHIRRGSEGLRDSLHRIWTFYVDPSTELDLLDSRLYDLCWRGIPPPLRGKVWQRALGNPLNLSGDAYQAALEQVRALQSKDPEQTTSQEAEMLELFGVIARDSETAFPELHLFQPSCPLYQDLCDVTSAYLQANPSKNYFFGISVLSALLLLQFSSPTDAFIVLSNMLDKITAITFHTSNAASPVFSRVQAQLKTKFSRLHDYLFQSTSQNGLGLTAQQLLEPVFYSLFSNGLDTEHLCRMLDVWFFKGDKTFISAAVAAVGALQSQIFGIQGNEENRVEKTLELLGWGPYGRDASGHWRFCSAESVDSFIGAVQTAGQAE